MMPSSSSNRQAENSETTVSSSSQINCIEIPFNDNENCLEENERLRGLQYDTCIQPEDLANYMGNEVYSVAPGEGRLPLQMCSDINNEVLTFPTLFPDGKFGFDVQRTPKLTLRKYFQARLLSEDTRFARNTEYLFYVQYLTYLTVLNKSKYQTILILH